MDPYHRAPKRCACSRWAYTSHHPYRKGHHHPGCPMGHEVGCDCIRCKRLRGEPDGLPRTVVAHNALPRRG
jgi:hypothetical protein